MNQRTVKYAALVVTGGFLVQLGACGNVIAQIALQNILSGILSALLDAIGAGTGAATTQ